MINLQLINTYLIVLNILTFIMFGLDKKRSISNKYRLSVTFLLSLALAGGSIGAYLAMYSFRHKTKKLSFKYGVLSIMVCQVILYLYLI